MNSSIPNKSEKTKTNYRIRKKEFLLGNGSKQYKFSSLGASLNTDYALV